MAYGDFSVTVGTYVIGRSSCGLTVDITDLTGVWSSTATTHNTIYRTRDGGHAGLDTESPRLIGVTFIIVSDTGSIDAVLDDLEAARTAWAPGANKTCTVVAPGGRSYRVRRRDLIAFANKKFGLDATL
jgi:hypothetical protein